MFDNKEFQDWEEWRWSFYNYNPHGPVSGILFPPDYMSNVSSWLIPSLKIYSALTMIIGCNHWCSWSQFIEQENV